MIHPPNELLTLLIGCTLKGAVAIAVLWAVRPLLRWLVGSMWVALFWGVVLARLLFPWSLESSWDPLRQWPKPVEAMLATGSWVTKVTVREGESSREPEEVKKTRAVSVQPVLVWWIWKTGVVLAALYFGGRSWIAQGVVRRSLRVDDGRLAKVWETFPPRMRGRIALRTTGEIPVAGLFGLWRPSILIPQDWVTALSDGELRHVLWHELGHARRGDLLWQWLFALARCVHWFNPLVWMAARWARNDAEMACDAWVLARSGEAEHGGYGTTLLRTSQLFRHHAPLAPFAVGMAASRRMLIVRIQQVGRYRPATIWRKLLGLMMLLTVAVFLMTRPAPAKAAATPAPATDHAPSAPSSAPAGHSTNGAAAPATPAMVAATEHAQVQIEAKFFEVAEETARDGGLFFGPQVGDVPPLVGLAGVITSEQLAKVQEKLQKAKGAELIAAPQVVVRSGGTATMEIIREFRYPTNFEMDKATGKIVPKDFESRYLGVTMEAEPIVGADGETIDLNLRPQMVKLEGFVGADGRTLPMASGRGVGADGTIDEFAGPPEPKDTVFQPVFSERKITTSVSIFSGCTVVLGGLRADAKQDGKAPVGRILYCLVTARILGASSKPDGVAPGPAAKSPAESGAQKPAAKEGGDVPVAKLVREGPPRYVRDPFDSKGGMIDVTGFPSGTEIFSPAAGKAFRVP